MTKGKCQEQTEGPKNHFHVFVPCVGFCPVTVVSFEK